MRRETVIVNDCRLSGDTLPVQAAAGFGFGICHEAAPKMDFEKSVFHLCKSVAKLCRVNRLFLGAAAKNFLCALALGATTLPLRADWLVATNGERFVGTVIEENSTNVVFDSELGGRLVFPQAKIRDLYRTPPVDRPMAVAAVAITNAPTNALAWTPPGSALMVPTGCSSSPANGCAARSSMSKTSGWNLTATSWNSRR